MPFAFAKLVAYQKFAAFADAASDGLFGQMLGGRWAAILAEAFVEPGHDGSYRFVTFVRDDASSAWSAWCRRRSMLALRWHH